MNKPTRKTGTRQKNLVATNFVAVGLLILVGYYKTPPNSTVTSTCHTVHEVEFCHWSDGAYSMTMPDGAFYTREHANDPWERDRSADNPRDETTLSKAKHKS